jgi:hypothetical protein
MDQDKKKKFISAMLLYCLSGDLAIRINYGGILIARVEDYMLNEMILKDAHHSYLFRILTAVDNIVMGSLVTRLQNSVTSCNLDEIKKIIVEKTFPIDQSWATEEALAGIESLGDLADIRLARYHFYSAADHYPASGTSASALSETIKSMDRCMQKVVDICDHYDLVEFGAKEWRENVTAHKEEVQ